TAPNSPGFVNGAATPAPTNNSKLLRRRHRRPFLTAYPDATRRPDHPSPPHQEDVLSLIPRRTLSVLALLLSVVAACDRQAPLEPGLAPELRAALIGDATITGAFGGV